MKVLIYCTKAKPYLVRLDDYATEHYNNNNRYMITNKQDVKELSLPILNGKVVASFELGRVDRIKPAMNIFNEGLNDINIYLNETEWVLPINESDYLNKTCLTKKEIIEYSQGKPLYAWHIDDLKVFDEAIELGELKFATQWEKTEEGLEFEVREVTKAPRSFMYVYYQGEKCLLLSVKSKWVEKILNGEKTIEIRKSVPKEVR